jgi:hypothetical protein
MVTEANLKAATINSYTIGEFGSIPFSQCDDATNEPWKPWPVIAYGETPG